MRSRSDSFGPIRQVGVSVAVGLPLFVVGVLFVFTLLVSLVGTGKTLVLMAFGILLAGFLAGLSRRVL